MESYTGSGTFTENRFQGLIPLIFSYEPGNLRLFAGSGVLFDAANKITRTSGGQYHEYRIPSKGFYTPVFHGGVGINGVKGFGVNVSVTVAKDYSYYLFNVHYRF